MDYLALRDELQHASSHLPLGIEIIQVGPGLGTALLPGEAAGTPGALYAVAEAASHAAIVGALGERREAMAIRLESALARYLLPAKGPIVACAALEGHGRDAGGVLEVRVDLIDEEGSQVGAVQARWRCTEDRQAELSDG
jgi:hypothetical protein